MSCNRENTIWQSKDGTWSRGFYEFWPVNQDDPDWDFEWDVEYGDQFHWVRTGLPSRQAAEECWDGANPGGYDSVAWSPESAAECERLDKLAAACKEAARAVR